MDADSGLVIFLTRDLSNRLLTLAQKASDREICGLVSGKAGKNSILDTCYPVKNIASDPQRHFEMEPKQLIDAIRTIRERNEIFKAIYHSHPTTSAFPSHDDLLQLAYEDVIYLIISLGTKGILDLRAFSLENKEIRELEIRIQN